MGICSHGNKGHSHSHAGCFPFLPIPIPNFVINSHSHGIPMEFPFPLEIPFPRSSLPQISPFLGGQRPQRTMCHVTSQMHRSDIRHVNRLRRTVSAKYTNVTDDRPRYKKWLAMGQIACTRAISSNNNNRVK